MRLRFRALTVLLLTVSALLPSGARADVVPVTCSISPDSESASVTLTNPFDYDVSCLATCKFATQTHDDNPQIICAKPVAARKEAELCTMKFGANRLVKFMGGTADCRKL